jgi:hypothetical protein
MNRTEYLVPSESSDVTLAPQDDKAKTHSEDNAFDSNKTDKVEEN